MPVYLRHEGEVKNKKLTKKDAVNILKDVWKEKMVQEQQVCPLSLLHKQRFLAQFGKPGSHLHPARRSRRTEVPKALQAQTVPAGGNTAADWAPQGSG